MVPQKRTRTSRITDRLMWLAPDAKYSSRFKYVELARFVPSLDRVVRIMESKHKPQIFEWSDIDKLRADNDNSGLYTSVFHYDERDLSKATRLGSLYFDIDSDDGGKQAWIDAVKMVDYLYQYHVPESIRIYFTGKKGFHIECEAIALNITPSNTLPDIFRYIANDIKDLLSIETLDFHVYDLRRMWRLPNSKHQTTNLYKVELNYDLLTAGLGTIKEYAETPHFEVVVPEQTFSIKSNEWYREWQYKKEVKSESLEERIQRFNKTGSNLVMQDDTNSVLEFQPEIFDKCPALMRLWNKAEQKHDLEHDERLFLCSILTFNKESEWYLHEILKNCDDYSFERTQSHIDDWTRRRELGIGGKPYSCERANQAGVGCGDCNLEAKEKLIRVGDKLVKTGEKASPSPVRFGYRRIKKEEEETDEEKINHIIPNIGKDKTEVYIWKDEDPYL